MDCKYCAGAGVSGFGGVLIVCLRCSGTGKEANHDDNTASERVAWFALLRCRRGHISYDEGDGRKERCREHVGAGNYCGAEREVIRVVEIDPLLRWLDDQIEGERLSSTPSDDAVLERIRTLRDVKAHIEGRHQ